MNDDKSKTTRSDAGVRTQDKHATTKAGRANGGEDNPGLITGKPGLDRIGGQSEARVAVTKRPTDEGDRETVTPGETDRIFTAASKERWGDGQPTLQEQMEAARVTEAAIAKKNRDR